MEILQVSISETNKIIPQKIRAKCTKAVRKRELVIRNLCNEPKFEFVLFSADGAFPAFPAAIQRRA